MKLYILLAFPTFANAVLEQVDLIGETQSENRKFYQKFIFERVRLIESNEK